MKPTIEDTIFKSRSTTFYPSTKLFPVGIQQDITRLYGFVRMADDYVDVEPQQLSQFKLLRQQWQIASNDPNFDTTAVDTDDLHTRLTKNMVQLSKAYGFERQWIVSFFDAMQMDVDRQTYKTLEDALTYVYGSAGVIGLMMARMMGLSNEALPYAQLQGRAMQWINFIRDIAEDNKIGRCYFPREDLDHFGLRSLEPIVIRENIQAFEDFVRFQIDRYDVWQKQANKGYRFIPGQARDAIQAAADAYNHVAGKIRLKPRMVIDRAVEIC
jgi:phytoene synthase